MIRRFHLFNKNARFFTKLHFSSKKKQSQSVCMIEIVKVEYPYFLKIVPMIWS
jgi:hypothetical protein